MNSSTLTGLVAEYYPNASLLPSQDQAVAAVNAGWTTLCGSTTFQQALASAGGGWFEFTSSMQDKNRTVSGGLVGSLFVGFQLTWNATCPATGAGYPAGYACEYQDTWQDNLTSRSVTGPASSITSLRFVPCETPESNQTAVGSVEGFFPDPGSVPNESVAVQEVQAIWGTICTSAAYYELAAPLDLPQALSWSTWRASTGPNSTISASGDLYFEWMLFSGDGPCPGANSSGYDCSYSESWTADLTLDTFSGPADTSSPGLGGAPLAPGPGGTDDTRPDALAPLAIGWGAFGSVLLAAVILGVTERRRR